MNGNKEVIINIRVQQDFDNLRATIIRTQAENKGVGIDFFVYFHEGVYYFDDSTLKFEKFYAKDSNLYFAPADPNHNVNLCAKCIEYKDGDEYKSEDSIKERKAYLPNYIIFPTQEEEVKKKKGNIFKRFWNWVRRKK